MVVRETIYINDEPFVKHYSDEGYMIRKIDTNEVYSEAIDIFGSEYEYEETDELMEVEDVDTQ